MNQCALSDLVLDENENWHVQPRCELPALYEVVVAEGVTESCPRHTAWMRETYDVVGVSLLVVQS